jgi:predicted RNase H-like nuclease (RuvC/YqgF family)
LIAGKSATPETGDEPQVSLEELQAENERLRNQLKKSKREWPEFQAITKELKDKNAEIHQLREQLGE